VCSPIHVRECQHQGPLGQVKTYRRKRVLQYNETDIRGGPSDNAVLLDLSRSREGKLMRKNTFPHFFAAIAEMIQSEQELRLESSSAER